MNHIYPVGIVSLIGCGGSGLGATNYGYTYGYRDGDGPGDRPEDFKFYYPSGHGEQHSTHHKRGGGVGVGNGAISSNHTRRS